MLKFIIFIIMKQNVRANILVLLGVWDWTGLNVTTQDPYKIEVKGKSKCTNYSMISTFFWNWLILKFLHCFGIGWFWKFYFVLKYLSNLCILFTLFVVVFILNCFFVSLKLENTYISLQICSFLWKKISFVSSCTFFPSLLHSS